ncbi:MAG: CheR family methyltransferase, partial [Segetibacter sp.]
VIEHYVEKKTDGKVTKIDEEEEEKSMAAITDLIKDKLPEDFSDYKKNTLLRRIKRRASLLNFNNLESYLSLLKQDTTELQNLAKDFLISVTSFFRDKEAFKIIEKRVVPELLQTKQNEEIKIWVAGCATGEEAYSFAILIREQLDAAQKNNPVKIFATDIDDEALQFAKKGCYNESIKKDVSPERLERFFTPDNNRYKINKSIREMLLFAHHDLIKNPPYCNMDFISCRNLLIYMNPALQKKVIGMLHFGLRFKGYLFLGPSENITDISFSVEEVDKKWKIYQNMESKRIMNFETFIAPPLIEGKRFSNPQKGSDKHSKQSEASAAGSDVSLLMELGYSGLWIDENNQVMNVFGDTSKFLLQKMFVYYLPDLLSKPLQISYSTACKEADKTNKLTVVKGINAEGIDSTITLFVKPLTKNEQGQVKRLVLFSKDEKNIAGKQTITFDESLYTNKYTANIEEELIGTKEKLASVEELLLASNENMQSFNEELLSANEEMQSTNEEMQSVNEELQTINSEYHSKIKELSDLNDDLNNYFRSNLNSQIFVNKDLVLMKFSPPTIALINVLETDIGRPLSNISTNIRFETI